MLTLVNSLQAEDSPGGWAVQSSRVAGIDLAHAFDTALAYF
jgi:hypothetical protein